MRTEGSRPVAIAYGVFWLDEWIVDSHDVDLTVLNTAITVSRDPETTWKTHAFRKT
jgi:hypothetical protein